MRTLITTYGRIVFVILTDCRFVSSCSPPRLTATQLPLPTGSELSRERLAPLRSRLLPGALIPAKAEARIMRAHWLPISAGMTFYTQQDYLD